MGDSAYFLTQSTAEPTSSAGGDVDTECAGECGGDGGGAGGGGDEGAGEVAHSHPGAVCQGTTQSCPCLLHEKWSPHFPSCT